MPEILEGKFDPMPSNPEQIKKFNKDLVLFYMFVIFMTCLGLGALEFGAWLGRTFFG